jgi:hypothetical protein
MAGGGLLVLIGLDTVSIGEPSARLADPSSGPATTAQEWGVSVGNSGEFPVIVTNVEGWNFSIASDQVGLRRFTANT